MPYSSKEEIREKYRLGNDLTKINAIPAKLQTEEIDENNPKRVAVYCRVSTDGLSQVTSFELQKKYYIKYVRKHAGWKLVGLYSDEGISATSIKNRIGLQMMLKDAIEGKIDLIVIKSISRFCRNLGDSLKIIKSLKNLSKPVGIFFETENISSLDPAMDLIIKVLSMVAEEESKKKSEAITAACRQRYAEGYFNVPSILGYRRSGVNKIEIDEDEAETVRLIYDMYLVGYDAKEIAQTLVELRRRKHTHIYLDGRIKEGDCDWNRNNVLQIFENEKRCGDVHAQKTYTFDCIEHIVRKNDNNVQMYYAVDQHPAIITRESLYLAHKIKESNRGGWKHGLQPIKAYYNGALKGFVRTVPNWHGYGYEDYAKASLGVYGIELPAESLYPYYVSLPETNKNKSMEEIISEESILKHKSVLNADMWHGSEEVQHLYLVTNEEFEGNVEFTEEELSLFRDKEDPITEAMLNLRQEIKSKNTVHLKEASARLFSTTEKALVTIDKNGFSFSRTCGALLDYESIVVYYNPIYNVILIGETRDDDPVGVSLKWKRDGVMRRCQAVGLCRTLFIGNGWNEQYKYRLIGRIIRIGDKKYIEFNLEDPIVRVPLKNIKSAGQSNEISENLMDKILSEVVSNGDLYSEIDGIKEMEMINKVENRSRAVYFDDLLSSGKNRVSVLEHQDDKFSPEFIGALRKNEVIPEEGWDYLQGMARFSSFYFDLFGVSWENSIYGKSDYKIDYTSEEVDEVRYVGWPTMYTFPSKGEVDEKIDAMRKKV